MLPPPRTSPWAHKVVPFALTQSAAAVGATMTPSAERGITMLAER
ncbi:hypothetical protein MBOL_15710 [Mycobacteroides abscessus subsp. bolletii BD]|nr:hypothetical protein MBOL_15710 [Mycobacteroides abscessus subsp. bolletii BD]